MANRMKWKTIVIAVILFVALAAVIGYKAGIIKFFSDRVSYSLNKVKFRTGDIIGHTSRSKRSRLIQEVTRSKYTHVGVIKKVKDGLWVIEAVGPVKKTRLKDWIERGKGGFFTVVRVKEKYNVKKLIKELNRNLGKPYDPDYSLDDRKIYCSELVYKAFLHSGVKLAKIETLKLSEIKDIMNKYIFNPGSSRLV